MTGPGRWLVAAVLSSLLTASAAGGEAVALRQVGTTPARVTTFSPRYKLTLDRAEFQLFSAALAAGVERAGGGVDLYWRVERAGEQMSWIIGANNEDGLKKLSLWVTTTPSPASTVPDSSRATLQRKLEQALAHPYWERTRITGRVVQQSGRMFLQATRGMFLLKGPEYEQLVQQMNRKVVVEGYIDNVDELEADHIRVAPENTLELAVMSHCPYGRNAENAVLNLLESMPEKDRPGVEVRYVIYKSDHGASTEYTSMHGPDELQEDLVQMAIRDHHRGSFFRYLRLRNSCDFAWDEVARRVGMTALQIEDVRRRIRDEQVDMLQREYLYVTKECDVWDGSPTYIWEGEKTPKIQDVAAFKGLSTGSGSCGTP